MSNWNLKLLELLAICEIDNHRTLKISYDEIEVVLLMEI